MSRLIVDSKGNPIGLRVRSDEPEPKRSFTDAELRARDERIIRAAQRMPFYGTDAIIAAAEADQ